MTKKGFTLLEVVIAVFLIIVGTTAVFVLITRTISIMAVSSSRLVAAYLVQDGIEIIRSIRDTNWIEIKTGSNSGLPPEDWKEGLTACSPCEVDYMDTTFNDPSLSFTDQPLRIDGNGFYNYTSGTLTKFYRQISINPGSDILEVTVTVTWEERGKSYSHTAREDLYNWR